MINDISRNDVKKTFSNIDDTHASIRMQVLGMQVRGILASMLDLAEMLLCAERLITS